jgi:hypothetical protein
MYGRHSIFHFCIRSSRNFGHFVKKYILLLFDWLDPQSSISGYRESEYRDIEAPRPKPISTSQLVTWQNRYSIGYSTSTL